jgi:hydroxymethylpyrimidine pyrophosphatase-like HAD family hydrolase
MNLSSNVRLIVCDAEGCITPPNRGIMNPEEIVPIAEYCRAARNDKSLPPLVLCTGRQIPYAECVVQMIGAFFPGYPSIVENGAFLYDVANNDILPNSALPLRFIEIVTELHQQVDKLIKKYGAKKESGKEICISLNPPNDLTIENFYEVVRKELDSYADLLEITHSMSAVDITPKGIDKASGVRQLAEITGIAPQKMLGIGDTRGDLPMLNLVGVPACPANATDEVKAVAQFIATQEGALGVAEILRHFTPWK